MSVFAVIASSAGSGRISPAKPNLTYIGTGQFRIENYSSVLNYVISGSGSRSGNILSITAGTANASIYSTSAKGISQSPTTTAYRQQPTTYFVQTGEPYVTYSTDGSNGGTYYDAEQWCGGCPAGFYAVITPGYYANTDYGPGGYTYNGASNEWWKIT